MSEERKSLADELLVGDERGLDVREAALVNYAKKLTREPGNVDRRDVEALREFGLSDREIHDAAHVAAYVAYVNRIASGLGVELEDAEAIGQWPDEHA